MTDFRRRRSWRIGAEPEYMHAWYIPDHGLERLDDWERSFRSGEADAQEDPLRLVGVIHRAGCPAIFEECRRLGGCVPCDVTATGAGRLRTQPEDQAHGRADQLSPMAVLRPALTLGRNCGCPAPIMGCQWAREACTCAGA